MHMYVHVYLHDLQAITLLGMIGWKLHPQECFTALTIIMDHLLTLPLNTTTEGTATFSHEIAFARWWLWQASFYLNKSRDVGTLQFDWYTACITCSVVSLPYTSNMCIHTDQMETALGTFLSSSSSSSSTTSSYAEGVVLEEYQQQGITALMRRFFFLLLRYLLYTSQCITWTRPSVS